MVIHWYILLTARCSFMYKYGIAYSIYIYTFFWPVFRAWYPCFSHIVLLNFSYAKINQIAMKSNK